MRSAAPAARGDVRRFAMKQLAPQTVGVAPGLGAAGWMAVGRHVPIIGTVATGGVLIAVTHFENLQNRVGKRFATGTPGAGNDRTIGSLLVHRRGSHRTGRRNSSTVSLAAIHESTERKSSTGQVRVMATLYIKNIPRSRNVPDDPSAATSGLPSAAKSSEPAAAEAVAEATTGKAAAPGTAAPTPTIGVTSEPVAPAASGTSSAEALAPRVRPASRSIPAPAAEARCAVLCLRPRLLLRVLGAGVA